MDNIASWFFCSWFEEALGVKLGQLEYKNC